MILTKEEREFMKKAANRLCVLAGIFFLLVTCACGRTEEKDSTDSVEARTSSAVADMAADTMEVHFPGLRQLHFHKTSYKIAGSRLNSGFFSVKSCQLFKNICCMGCMALYSML